MKHIYFIRHAETEGNKRQMLMGCRIDTPLSEIGIMQAKNLAQKLKDFPIESVFVSSNTRAQDTARLLFDNSLQAVVCDQLREQDFGSMTGTLLSDIPAHINESFFQDPYHFRHEGGESLADLKDRLAQFMRENIESNPAQHIAIITHENVIKAVVGYMKDLSHEITALKFNNCSVTQYIFNDSDYEAICINRIYH